jgi:hypothetical protein
MEMMGVSTKWLLNLHQGLEEALKPRVITYTKGGRIETPLQVKKFDVDALFNSRREFLELFPAGELPVRFGNFEFQHHGSGKYTAKRVASDRYDERGFKIPDGHDQAEEN